MSEATMTSIPDIAKRVQTEAEASAVYGVAEGMAKQVGVEKYMADAAAEMAAVDLEGARAKIERSGANKVVAELAAALCNTQALGAEIFANFHNWREKGRVAKALRERDHIKSVIDTSTAFKIAEHKTNVDTARARVDDKDNSVGKGLLDTVVVKPLEKVGLSVMEVYKSWEKHWKVVNEKDAQIFHNRKEWANKKASELRKEAADRRAEAYAKYNPAGSSESATLDAATAIAKATNAALEKVVGRNYLMGEANAVHDQVLEQGGDSNLQLTKDAAAQWASDLGPKQQQ